MNKIYSLKQYAKIGAKFLQKRLLTRCSYQEALEEVYGPKYKVKPYPYKKHIYTIWSSFLDGTTKRLDEDAKIISVEGPVASGKTEMAEFLADNFGLFYFPEANQDMYHINYYGYDLRQLDPLVHPDCRSLDINNFLLQPSPKLCCKFQFHQFFVKFHQYVDAMTHLLHTGQGVALQRCAFSDWVFIETMLRRKMIPKRVQEGYYDMSRTALSNLYRPHLYVYLHVPVEKILENIEERNYPHEVHSNVLTPEFLQEMEFVYKEKFLKEAGKYSEVLIFDWTDGMPEDCDFVLDEIESLDLDRGHTSVTCDTKFPDWRFLSDSQINATRYTFTSQKTTTLNLIQVPKKTLPELYRDPNGLIQYENIRLQAPGEKYIEGYNPQMGDTYKSMWSYSNRLRRRLQLLPLRERRTCFPPIVVN